jgi:hypothetical protein
MVISLEALRAVMATFIKLGHHRRYHEGIRTVTPADIYYARREQILKPRMQQKQVTLDSRFQYNLGQAAIQTPGELGRALQLGKRLDKSQRC